MLILNLFSSGLGIVDEYRACPGDMPVLLFHPQIDVTPSAGNWNMGFPTNVAGR